jgi:ubiquinone/menaquinone biosynthesis C-methylase UbiE
VATPDEAKNRAASTYNAAADRYDDDANSFRARFGAATIERLALRPVESFDAVVCEFGIFFVPDMPAAVRELWRRVRPGGVDDARVGAVPGTHPIASSEAWWSAVLGSGYRGTVDQLDPAARERVRAANAEYIRREGVREVEANVVHAIATKPLDRSADAARDPEW